nr:hypothetical protein [Tanacetum cinerariifolium]
MSILMMCIKLLTVMPMSDSKVKAGLFCIAVAAAELSPISNLYDGAVNLTLFWSGMSDSRMISIQVGDGRSISEDGINGSRDDSSDNEDGDGDKSVGVEAYSAIRASVDGDRGSGGDVVVDLSVSKGSISSAEGKKAAPPPLFQQHNHSSDNEDGINGSGDDSSDNEDGDGDEGVAVEAYSAIRASVDGDRGI